MGTKSTINKQGTIRVRWGAKKSVMRDAASIRSTQPAKRKNRTAECVGGCIDSPPGSLPAIDSEQVYLPGYAEVKRLGIFGFRQAVWTPLPELQQHNGCPISRLFLARCGRREPLPLASKHTTAYPETNVLRRTWCWPNTCDGNKIGNLLWPQIADESPRDVYASPTLRQVQKDSVKTPTCSFGCFI
jgi:hypothetical protein